MTGLMCAIVNLSLEERLYRCSEGLLIPPPDLSARYSLCGGAVASELESQQPHSSAGVFRWSEFPFAGCLACQAREIGARAGALHEFADDIASGVDEDAYRHSNVTVDSNDDGAGDFGKLFVKDAVGLIRWRGGRTWCSGCWRGSRRWRIGGDGLSFSRDRRLDRRRSSGGSRCRGRVLGDLLLQIGLRVTRGKRSDPRALLLYQVQANPHPERYHRNGGQR